MLKRNAVPVFFILTFTLTWAMWIPAVLIKIGGGTSVLGPDNPIGQFGRWAPGTAAMILTALMAGKQGLASLFRSLKIWRVNIGWYLFALFFQPALFFISKWIDFFLLGRSYEIVSPLAVLTYPIAFVIPSIVISAIPGAFMEELGWRRFALPRLQIKNTALMAGVILGLVWGLWHIPAMLFLGRTDPGNILWDVVSTIPVAILFIWLFNNTGGSLLLATLFHASIQYSENFLGMIPSQTITLLKWLVAILVLVVTGATHLSKKNERIQCE